MTSLAEGAQCKSESGLRAFGASSNSGLNRLWILCRQPLTVCVYVCECLCVSLYGKKSSLTREKQPKQEQMVHHELHNWCDCKFPSSKRKRDASNTKSVQAVFWGAAFVHHTCDAQKMLCGSVFV